MPPLVLEALALGILGVLLGTVVRSVLMHVGLVDDDE